MVTCPKGHKMVIRSGRYGRFYGCSNYPGCKETKPLSTKSTKKKKPSTTKSKKEFSNKICAECGAKKIRVYDRGDSICDSCKTRFKKVDTELLMESKPLEIKSVAIDEVPINAFIEMENNIMERESDTLVALFRESQLDPETNPIQFGALWVVGKEIIEKNDSSQTKRICAPLLIYDLEL